MNMKVAGYIRVSTKQQKKDESHEKQRDRLERWAEKNEHEIKVYEDVAVSGQAKDREDYNDLMNNLEKYDGVVVRELSRFGRNLQKVLNDIDKLEEKGVEFISLRDNIDTTTAQGKLFFNIKTSFNQYWSDLAREQAREMVQRRREQGKEIGRPQKLPKKEIEEIKNLHNEGVSYRAISKLTNVDEKFSDGVSTATVRRYCKGD